MNYFPIILAILDLLAGFFYLKNKDLPRAIYWFCAGGLTISTLYFK